MVSVSVLLLGMSLYSRLKMRKAFLAEILLFLSNVKIEIEYINLPVYQMLNKIHSSGICKNLSFISSCIKKIDQGEDFSTAWYESVSNSFLPMKKEEREKLSGLGNFLGASDLQGQISLLSLFYENFSAYYKKADEDFEKYGKMCVTVSCIVAVGIFIFIM